MFRSQIVHATKPSSYRIAHSTFRTATAIEYSHDEGRSRGEEDVVQTDGPPFEHGLTGERTGNGEVELHTAEKKNT